MVGSSDYEEAGEETAVGYGQGQVFWIDAVAPDQKSMGSGEALPVTFK